MSSSAVRLLQVFDGLSGQKRNLVLYQGMDTKEVLDVLRAAFSASVLALRDPATGIVYPASVLSAHPHALSPSIVFETVLARELHDVDKALSRSRPAGSLGAPRQREAWPDDDDDEDEDEDETERADEEGEEDEEEQEAEADVPSPLPALSLAESLEQLHYLTGLDYVSLEAALSLLPVQAGDQQQGQQGQQQGARRDSHAALPSVVTRADFAEMLTVLQVRAR